MVFRQVFKSPARVIFSGFFLSAEGEEAFDALDALLDRFFSPEVLAVVLVKINPFSLDPPFVQIWQ
jgi:hypothetical protein